MTTEKSIREGFRQIQEGVKLLNSGSLDYQLNKLFAYKDLVLKKYAPFKVGDKVKLKKVPEITYSQNCGWYGYKNLFYSGSVAVVTESDFNVEKQKLQYGIQFEDESSTKHTFWLDDRYLELVSTVCSHENFEISATDTFGFGHCTQCKKEVNVAYVINNALQKVQKLTENYEKPDKNDKFLKKKIQTINYLEKFFKELRFNEKHHLGLGDVRITSGQQDQLIRKVAEILINNDTTENNTSSY